MKKLALGSLRVRFVLPHLAAALLAALGVAIVSAFLGRSWALRDVMYRVKEIELTLNGSTVPLTPPVLNSAADLTGTELITLESRREISQTTVELTDTERGVIGELLESHFVNPEATSRNSMRIEVAGRHYLVFPFERQESSIGRDRVRHVLVLADAESVDAAGKRAALLPLATGFSCILLLTTLTIAVSNHLVKRLINLERSVQKVASGDFESTVADSSTDEVGQLGRAVDAMAAQLKRLWSQVNRQQSERLLHLIAGGMAHQLRNTLTGARMAVELHAQKPAIREQAGEGDELQVALRELDTAEDYVRRLLLVGAGKSQEEKPELLMKCLHEVYTTHAAVAKHLRVALSWPCEHRPDQQQTIQQPDERHVRIEGIHGYSVADGAAFSAAISNLVLNAMQAAGEVDVDFWLVDDCQATTSMNQRWQFVFQVSDNGPGIDSSIEAELFEPFVTSKPEGMGLGLALVRRSAEQLGGGVRWSRNAGRTVFEFTCQVNDGSSKS